MHCFLLLLFIFAASLLPAAEDWFDFAPPTDPFTDDALVDFRSGTRAGSEGWVVSRDGKLFCQDSGRQLRLLSVNGPSPTRGSWGNSEQRRYLAKRLAKLGVNHVRLTPVRGAHKLNEGNLDGFKELVARCAEEGIYSMVTFYFPFESRMDQIPGHSTALVYFHPQAQAQYEVWLERIVNTPNRHSGKTLAQDPAVAMIELINEDNLFFSTFKPSKMPEPVRAILEQRFATWLIERYGSLAKAFEAWGGGRRKDDKPEAQRMSVYDAYWFADADWARAGRHPARAADTLRFLTQLQQDFFARMTAKLREWGYGGQVITTNWKTVNQAKLGALDKYSNMAGTMLDRHAYFESVHKSVNRKTYLVQKGDHYRSRSQLTTPDMLMRGVNYTGFPQFISEHYYPAPNRFRAEMIWIGAHYGALYGIDGFSTNEIHKAQWPQKPRKKYDANSPINLGQYPAAACVYREGAISEAEPIYRETVTPEQLYRFQGTQVHDAMKLETLRAGEAIGTTGKQKGLDPLAWLVGPVEISIADQDAETMVADVSAHVDRQAKTVSSSNGQLEWDYGQGVVTSHAPAAQGACGFLAEAGAIELPDARISIGNEYAALWLCSLDGKPIAESERILLQVITEQRIGGRLEEPARFTPRKKKSDIDGLKILATGTGPMQLRSVIGTVALKRADAAQLQVIACDHNGYARETLPDGADAITLLPDVLWYVIRKP